jgi:hypothetical protein
VVLGALLLIALFASGLSTFVDPDLYHCLAHARLLVTTGEFPVRDTFAYTPTVDRVVHHEWLTGLFHLTVVNRFGGTGLLALRLAVEGLLVAGAFGLAWRGGARLPVLVLVGPLALGLMTPGLTLLRAQAWTLLFTTILLWLLDLDRRGSRRWIPAYLLLHVVWLNVHGGFVVGMALIGAHGLEQALSRRPWRHLVLGLLAAAALVAVNPHGLEYPRYLWEAMRMDRGLIEEWRPLWDGPAVAVPVWAISVLVLVYALQRLGIDRCHGWLTVLAVALACLRYQRHVSIYGIIWVASVAPMLQQARLGTLVDSLWRTRPVMISSTLVVALMLSLRSVAADVPWRLRVPALPCNGPCVPSPVVYPVGPVEYLRDAAFRGNAFVPFHAGAYVSWQLRSAVRVSIDGRWEAAYPPALLIEHVKFFGALDEWASVRARYSTDVVVVERHQRVVEEMLAEQLWPLVYQDDGWVVFARPGLELPIGDRRGERFEGRFP